MQKGADPEGNEAPLIRVTYLITIWFEMTSDLHNSLAAL